MNFDIAEDEFPIFLAETDDQFQILDEGLVRLEREQDDQELLQAIFRAAHTLKGSAGMIGHQRMVRLTHALETALDGVRKHSLAVTASLIDLCLIAVDAIRQLRDEVSRREACPVDVEALAGRFSALLPATADPSAQPTARAGQLPSPAGQAVSAAETGLAIEVEIAADSAASAARAFQIMLALQELGQILSMTPSAEQIETAVPVRHFSARLSTAQPEQAVRQALEAISELDQIEIGGDSPAGAAGPPKPPASPIKPDQPIGEYLVEHRYITRAQLEQALAYQAGQKGEKPLLGQVLVRLGMLSQETLDQAVVEQLNRLRSALDARGAQPIGGEQQRPSEKTVRTSVERLDILMNLVGELITDRNRLYQVRNELETSFRGNGQLEALSETITHVSRITDQLQAEVMGIRMLPVSNVFNKFPRLVRDLARQAGKQVELVISGGNTELDRSVIEEISDPLIHLLRNAVDHGIENARERAAYGKPAQGKVSLSARHEQGRIILTVKDDGRGIRSEDLRASAVKKGLLTQAEAAALSDDEAIDLVFLSGLSTAGSVSDISGRGVGMDIVRTNIERLNGNIQIETWPGRGTQFEIILPLTLAIVPALLVRVAAGTYAIPIVTVLETLRIAQREIQTIAGKSVILLRDQVLPVAKLADLFGLPASANGRAKYEYVVVVRSGKSQLGLIVDGLVGEHEVVVKSLSAIVGEIPGITSAAILGDGQVALILEVQGLFKLAALQNGHEREAIPAGVEKIVLRGSMG
jgi:two-component system chemotaxis sensor kinase CheA